MMNFESSGADRKHSMKSSISFSSDLFADAVDGGHAGGDIAKLLVSRAIDDEFQFGEPVLSDAGWTIPVTSGNETFVVGIDDSAIGNKEAEWAITVEKTRKWKIFGEQDSDKRARLCDLIQNILREEPHIGEVRWSD